jgi:hypothetical protein
LDIEEVHKTVSLRPNPPDKKFITYQANQLSGSTVIKIPNGGMDSAGGFGDLQTGQNGLPDYYAFRFSVPISDFSLRMLDFGDYNPKQGVNHRVKLSAYDTQSDTVGIPPSGSPVATAILDYTTPNDARNPKMVNPVFSPEYGNLQHTGDALEAKSGQPGNWTWHVSGNGIVEVDLDFTVAPNGFDPNLGFDRLRFITDCP